MRLGVLTLEREQWVENWRSRGEFFSATRGQGNKVDWIEKTLSCTGAYCGTMQALVMTLPAQNDIVASIDTT